MQSNCTMKPPCKHSVHVLVLSKSGNLHLMCYQVNIKFIFCSRIKTHFWSFWIKKFHSLLFVQSLKLEAQQRCDIFPSTLRKKWLEKEMVEKFKNISALGCNEAGSYHNKYNIKQKLQFSNLTSTCPEENSINFQEKQYIFFGL